MPHTKEKKNEETTISPFVNNIYSEFAVALTSFKYCEQETSYQFKI
jgi:hypothetical protein